MDQWGRLPHPPQDLVRAFLRLSAEAGLPRIRLRDVRHTYATAVLEAAEGWHDVKVLSQRLGHKSVGTTLDTYASVLPAVAGRATESPVTTA